MYIFNPEKVGKSFTTGYNIYMEPIRWNALEFEHKEKTNDWYWTVGVISLGVSVWRFWVADYMFGVFVLLAGLCLILLGGHKPEYVDIVVDEDGILIGHNLYLWSNVSGYAMVVSGGKATLLLETNRKIVPVIDLKIPETVSVETLESFVSMHTTAKDLLPSRSQAIMKFFGF